MDALNAFFEHVKKNGLAQGRLLGFFHVLIGRTIRTVDGTLVSAGLSWRELSEWLKKTRWDPDAVLELGMQPQKLPPRDRQRYWYTAIARARVDAPAALAAGEAFIAALRDSGYDVEDMAKKP